LESSLKKRNQIQNFWKSYPASYFSNRWITLCLYIGLPEKVRSEKYNTYSTVVDLYIEVKVNIERRSSIRMTNWQEMQNSIWKDC
jgi:hypothetical protein